MATHLVNCSKNILNLLLVRKNLQVVNKINICFLTAHYNKLNSKDFLNSNAINTGDDQDKEVVISTIREYKNKHCPGIKYVTSKMQHLFDLSTAEAKEILNKCPALKKCTSEILSKNFHLCQEAGISKETLIQYPILLTLNNLKSNIEYLHDLSVDINLLAPMLNSHAKVLKRIVEDAKLEENIVPYGNRVIYISKLLNLPTQLICEKLIRHNYVLRLPFDRLESILKVLLDYGIEPQNIINDCWALRYSPQTAEERLQKAIEADVVKVKTWMIRCQDKVFDRCITRQVQNRKILGSNSSVEEYLSKRLECSIENAKYLTEKYPAIMKMSILKMKEILDFLYEQGYTPVHVCRVPRILIHSLETTKVRIQQLKQYGYVPPSLAILCKSKRDFDKILKKNAKRQKNADMQLIKLREM